MNIRDYLKENILVSDGAFGTYYAERFDTEELPELANVRHPKRVVDIHSRYIEAGAKLLRTNTYACNTLSLGCDIDEVCDNVKKACEYAFEAASGRDVYVAGDIGPIAYENFVMQDVVCEEYIRICRAMVECGVDAIVFETFSQIEDILPAIDMLREYPDIFVIVQFAVNQFGYSSAGLSARRLFLDAIDNLRIDAIGLNCGVGPGHMHQILSKLSVSTSKCITALPNAGYPHSVSNRMVFASDNAIYFAKKAKDMVQMGVGIIGGCCGTTPDYISNVVKEVSDCKVCNSFGDSKEVHSDVIIKDNSFFAGKEGKKLIAVELAPPIDSDDQKLMDAAHILQKSGVDVLTFPDSPSGRTRADSILMAEKVAKETGLCVMPHLCCRDKNAIAMRSQLLGAHINSINNFLVITGDPIPSVVRQTVKAVFNFDSVGLMNIIKDMNSEQFTNSKACYGGAINQNRANIDVEIARVKKKMAAGATFFMTQPVFDEAGVKLIKRFREETGARILCGIMPFVSLKNALFMKNEMTGIEVSDEIINRYKTCETKEDGEAVGIAIAKEVIEMTKDIVDGYYFSFPFNRVYLLDKILK